MYYYSVDVISVLLYFNILGIYGFVSKHWRLKVSSMVSHIYSNKVEWFFVGKSECLKIFIIVKVLCAFKTSQYND